MDSKTARTGKHQNFTVPAPSPAVRHLSVDQQNGWFETGLHGSGEDGFSGNGSLFLARIDSSSRRRETMSGEAFCRE